MAVLNKYIENRKYNLTDEAKDFKLTGKVHPSRLLNPKTFSISESPIYEGGVVDVGSLAMVAKAAPFLHSFTNHINEMVNHLLKGMSKNQWMPLEYKLNEGSKQVIKGIELCRFELNEELAVISEYIIRHFPEDGRIIENDWSRKNPHNWLKIIHENGEDPFDYGFEEHEDDGETHLSFSHDPEYFSAEKIGISEDQFISRVASLVDLTPKLNFAIETACSILNLLNNKFFRQELKEFVPDQREHKGYLDTLNEAPSSSEVFTYCTRWHEANFRKRKYNHKHKLPVEHDDYFDFNEANTPYWHFIKANCIVYSDDFRKALKSLNKNGVSIRYKGKTLEKLKEMAKLYPKYLVARITVQKWYSSRFEKIEDQEMEDAMAFLLLNLPKVKTLIDVRERLNSTLFIADQRVVSDTIEKGEKLPSASEIKTEMDAVEKLGPHLEKLGLKIVPIRKEDSRDTARGGDEVDTRKLAPVTNLTASVIPKEPSLELIRSLQNYQRMKQTMKAGETEEFDENFGESELVKKWKNTDTYKNFYKKLGGSGECTLVQIGLVKGNTILLTGAEESERTRLKEAGKKVARGNKVTPRGAANAGKKFVTQAGLEPCQNYDTVLRTDASIIVLERAFREKKKLKKITVEQKSAGKALAKDKDFQAKPDLALEKHLRKLKLTKNQVNKYLKQVDEFEGKVTPNSNTKFNTQQVAIAFCEGQRN